MQKTVKAFSVALAVLMLCMLSSVMFVNAADKDYEIESVKFDVQLMENGDAIVKEIWQVDYIDGEFSRFYKNIYRDLPVDENFSIDFISVKVDGEECRLTSDTESRNDYTYAVVREDDVTRYEVYIHSEEESRKFEIAYVLEDVVKLVDDEFYWFEYRFLPMGYKQNIKNFDIVIKAPDDVKVSVESLTGGDFDADDGIVEISDSDVSDLYKVSVKIVGDCFDDLSGSSCISSSDLNSLEDDIGLIVLVSVGATALLAAICFGIGAAERKKFEKILAENPGIIFETYRKWVTSEFTPAEFISKVSPNGYLNYLVYLADMASKDMIRFDEEYKNLIYPVNNRYRGNYEKIIAILDDCREKIAKKNMNCEVINNHWILPTSYLEAYFKKASVYSKVVKAVQESCAKKDYDKRQFRKDRDFLQRALAVMNTKKELPLIELSEVISTYHNAGIEPLYYCFQKMNKNDETARDNSAYLTMFAILYYSQFGGSDTVCSSCSSCGGGCGGCGGSD